RNELESAGERFTTSSDCEVLLKAFRKWNVGCLDKLNGMFAFAVWDDLEKTLTLIRDRAGIKPLFYAHNGNGFVFASEIKAILATEIVVPELDHESLNQSLTFLWPVPPRTMFKGVSQILPGHYLVWQQARETQKVMLSGMGGDEVFGGYPRQMAMQIAGVTDIVPSAVRRPIMKAAESMLYGGLSGQFTAPIRNAKKFARSAAMDF